MTASDGGLRTVSFESGPDACRDDLPPPHLQRAVELLERYLDGDPVDFGDISLDLEGATEFQRKVWERLREIPRGRVVSYGYLAEELAGGPDAARAVGGAVGSNPLPIVIPCHRVVRSDGGLGGFGGGLPRKVALLRLEGVDVEGVVQSDENGLEGFGPSSRVSEEILRLDL